MIILYLIDRELEIDMYVSTNFSSVFRSLYEQYFDENKNLLSREIGCAALFNTIAFKEILVSYRRYQEEKAKK